jgi:hypothetical protein
VPPTVVRSHLSWVVVKHVNRDRSRAAARWRRVHRDQVRRWPARRGCGSVAEAVRQGVVADGVFGLQWPTALMYGQRPWADVIAAATCGSISFLLYRVSRHAHSKFGDLFKATFDQYQATIDLSQITHLVADEAGDSALPSRPFRERNAAIYRFLRRQRVRRPSESRNRRVW